LRIMSKSTPYSVTEADVRGALEKLEEALRRLEEVSPALSAKWRLNCINQLSVPPPETSSTLEAPPEVGQHKLADCVVHLERCQMDTMTSPKAARCQRNPHQGEKCPKPGPNCRLQTPSDVSDTTEEEKWEDSESNSIEESTSNSRKQKSRQLRRSQRHRGSAPYQHDDDSDSDDDDSDSDDDDSCNITKTNDKESHESPVITQKVEVPPSRRRSTRCPSATPEEKSRKEAFQKLNEARQQRKGANQNRLQIVSSDDESLRKSFPKRKIRKLHFSDDEGEGEDRNIEGLEKPHIETENEDLVEAEDEVEDELQEVRSESEGDGEVGKLPNLSDSEYKTNKENLSSLSEVTPSQLDVDSYDESCTDSVSDKFSDEEAGFDFEEIKANLSRQDPVSLRRTEEYMKSLQKKPKKAKKDKVRPIIEPKIYFALVEALRPLSTDPKNLTDHEVVNEFGVYETGEDETCESRCICGKEEIR